ncbi:uncharacterized protein LOC131941488 [Physella acuta]|uniref:uncharacterized protein LOC131941488 n=1 Tax=Physella acuta TaxID=109671 RepID=UPI0027DC5DD4|nr:uncharacterized protein LOC131941488 [Physella acuta]
MASSNDGPVCDDITKPLELSQDSGVDTAYDAVKFNPTSVTYRCGSPTKKDIVSLQDNRNFELYKNKVHDIKNCDTVFAVSVEEKCNLNYRPFSYPHQEIFLEDDNREHFKMVLKVTNTPVSRQLQAGGLFTQQKCITTQRCTSINKADFNSTGDNTNSSDKNGFGFSCLVKNNLPSSTYLTYPVPSFFLASHRNKFGDVIFGPRHRTDKKVRNRVSFTPSDGLCSYVEKTEFDRKMPVKTATKYQVVPTSDEVSEGHFLSYQTPFYESFGSANPSDSVVKSSELSPLRKPPKGNCLRANVLYELDKENKKTDLPSENVEDFEPNALKKEKSKSDIASQDVEKYECSIFYWKFLDFALAYLWVGPLVTVYWCNTWHIPEHYFFPKDPVVSAWISGAAGYTIFFLASLFQDTLTSFTVRRRAITRQIMMQLFSYVMGLACVNQWRCVWVLLDEYTGVSTMNAAVTYACASVLLLLLRCHRGTVSPPAYIRMDFPVDKHFVVGKYFDAQVSNGNRAGVTVRVMII